MSDATFERIKGVLSDRMAFDVTSLKPDSDFTDLDIQLFDALELAIALEEEMNVDIPDTEITHWRNIADVSKTLEGLKHG